MRDKKNIYNFFVLVSIYSILYFEQIFIANTSISLASSFETDPGSILDSIYKMFNSPIYSCLIVTAYPKLKYKLDQRLDFNKSLVAISYQYLDGLESNGLIVFHDQFVAVPNNHISCHFWKDCNNLDYVSSIEPDYIIYAENYKIDWATYNNQPKRIYEYIKKSGSYYLLTVLDGSGSSIINDNPNQLKLYVYKKI